MRHRSTARPSKVPGQSFAGRRRSPPRPRQRLGRARFRAVTARRDARIALSLCPGPEVGVVTIFGLAADRNGLSGFAILRASRWVVNCLGSAGT